MQILTTQHRQAPERSSTFKLSDKSARLRVRDNIVRRTHHIYNL